MQKATEDMDRHYRAQSFWLDSLPGTLAPRPALKRDTRADVVIVGAGYTGLWTAYYLKRHAPGMDVAILEAEVAGYGASGRNGGWCSAYLAGIEDWLDDPAHTEAALRLQRLMFDAVAETGRVCEAEGIDAHYLRSGHLEAAVNPAQLRRLEGHIRHAESLGLGDHFIRLGAQEVANKVAIEGTLGAMYTPHCAAVHPARLARGLADAAAKKGVRLFERSPVLEFGPGRVGTERGSVRAATVILATEGYIGRLPGLKRKLIPVHSTMVATEPLSDAQAERAGLHGRYCFSNGDHIVTYGHLAGDGRVAFGCRGSYAFGSGILSFDDADDTFTVVRRTLLHLLPGLEGVRFTHAWGGCMGVSRSLRPSVCLDREAGIGWAGGYFGNGVGAAHLAGRTLADLVLGRDTERLHTPWVNPPGECGLRARLWEPEPLRWLGINARARWMHWTDIMERHGSVLERPFNWALEHFFP